MWILHGTLSVHVFTLYLSEQSGSAVSAIRKAEDCVPTSALGERGYKGINAAYEWTDILMCYVGK